MLNRLLTNDERRVPAGSPREGLGGEEGGWRAGAPLPPHPALPSVAAAQSRPPPRPATPCALRPATPCALAQRWARSDSPSKVPE